VSSFRLAGHSELLRWHYGVYNSPEMRIFKAVFGRFLPCPASLA
jgi:hypothetical protein